MACDKVLKKHFCIIRVLKTTNNFNTFLIIIIVPWGWCRYLSNQSLSKPFFLNKFICKYHKVYGKLHLWKKKKSSFLHNYLCSYSMGSEISPPQSRQPIYMFRRWFTLALGWDICSFAKCHRHTRHQQELPPQQYWQWSWHWWRIWQLKSLAVCGCNKT